MRLNLLSILVIFYIFSTFTLTGTSLGLKPVVITNEPAGSHPDCLVLFKNGEYERAISCYDDTINYICGGKDTSSQCMDAWNRKCISLTKLNQSDEAIQGFNKAIQLQPSCPDCSKDEQTKRVGGWEVSLPSTCPECWNNKGITLANQSKYYDAIRCFDVAIQLNSDYPQPWINKGIALYIVGRFDEALRCIDKATRLDPSNGNALYLRSFLQERVGLNASIWSNGSNEQNTTMGAEDAQVNWQWMVREYAKEQWKEGTWIIIPQIVS